MSAKNYLTASDVSEYMGISIPMAYKITGKPSGKKYIIPLINELGGNIDDFDELLKVI